MKRLKISLSVSNNYLLTETLLRFKKKYRVERKFWRINDYKLDNAISRAKSNILNICQFNPFYFFFTQTINSCYDRSDLKSFIDKFNNICKYLNKKHSDCNFYYIVIPEFHSDKSSYHLHGFLSKDFEKYCYINKNGFFSISVFDKLGFNSVSEIKSYDAAIHYCLKYICKDNFKDFSKGQHIYYCSNGLARDNVVNDLVLTQIAPIHYDFKSQYVFKTKLSEEQYYNFITRLDSIDCMQYYNYIN